MLKLVVFDFDGVIAQTFAMCLGLNQRLDPELTAEQYRTKFEGNINEAKAKVGHVPKMDFFGEYAKQILQMAIIPGIADVIKTLSSHYMLAISSSTINPPIELFLQQHDLLEYFATVFGNNIDPSKIVKFKLLMEKFNVTADDCLFITDTSGDVNEAAAVNIQTIAITWGYHDRARLAKAHPAAILDSPDQILPTIAELTK